MPKVGTDNMRSRTFFMTLNNPTEADRAAMDKIMTHAVEVQAQEEVGESGTPHIQGYFRFKEAVLRRTFCAWFDSHPHVEKPLNLAASRNYCKKLESRDPAGRSWGLRPPPKGGPPPIRVRDPLMGKVLHPWQAQLLEEFEEIADDRQITWIWSEEGGVGKTSFAKHVCTHYKAILVGGKAADAMSAIATMKEKPDIVLFDVSRASTFVSYSGMESIKNGLFFNGKYESGMVLMNNPHVVVFANFEPDRSKLSEDRWRVIRIGQGARAQ